MKKKLFALILCLTLIVSGTALAAPTRDQQHSELTVTDTLQSFLDFAMGAAVLKGEMGLENGTAPSQNLVEGIFGVGIYSLVLPYDGDDIWSNKAILTEEELQALYGMVFGVGDYTVPEDSLCECIMINGKDVAFDLSPLEEQPAVGVYVYRTETDDQIITLYADLFTHYGPLGVSAADVPDDALTWYAGAVISLKADDNAPYGYLLNGFEIGAPFADGMIADWSVNEHEKLGLSFTAPSVFGVAETTDDMLKMQTADGEATLTVNVAEVDALVFETYLEKFSAEHEKMTVRAEKGFKQFTAEDEDEFSVFVIDEAGGRVYCLTIAFPAEKNAEYTLYGELIRNSFVVWSLANG